MLTDEGWHGQVGSGRDDSATGDGDRIRQQWRQVTTTMATAQRVTKFSIRNKRTPDLKVINALLLLGACSHPDLLALWLSRC